MNDLERRILLSLAKALNSEISEISKDSRIDYTRNWDSLSQMNVVFALEEEFSIDFDAAELDLLISFEGIKRILQLKRPDSFFEN